MFLQESIKKEENPNMYDSDSDDQVVIKSPSPESPERKEVIDLATSDSD